MTLESLSLEDNDQIVFTEGKSLYFNMPIGEAIKIALRELYSSNLTPEIPRSAMKNLLKLAVTIVHFKCNGILYVQSDGLAMGAPLAVTLANVWMKLLEAPMQNQSLNISRTDQNSKSKDCNRRVTFRGRGVECESCKNCKNCAKCLKKTNGENVNMGDVVWIRTHCSSQQTEGGLRR